MIKKSFEGFFAKVDLSRDEYIKRWLNHFSEFYKIADSDMDYNDLDDCKSTIKRMAGNSWDKQT